MQLFMKMVSLQLNYLKIMLLFQAQNDLISHLNAVSNQKTVIGFVPTMGALHEGHISLIKEAQKNNSLVVVSIFVNPTQFNNADDLAKYPNTLKKDIEKITTVSDEIILFAPTVEDIYKDLIVSKSFDFEGLENQMEGKFRPGHFNGVGTVVKLLFEIVKPNNAYFGEKDFQQLQIIKKLVEKYKLNVNIVPCPVHRESNGLAMSSRNERLSENERDKASIIFETLKKSKILFKTKSVKLITEYVAQKFEPQNIFTLEYFEIADEDNLLTCVKKNPKKKYRAFIAVFVNNIRLIDTISLN